MKRINRLGIFLFLSTVLISLFLASWFVNDVFIDNNITCGFASIYVMEGLDLVCKSFLPYYILAVLAATLYLNLFISPVYIFIIYLNIRRKNNNKRIENEDIIYQRELPTYNSAIVAYILDGIIEVEQDYNALLIEMIEKGIITKQNEQYIANSKTVNTETEKYVLETLNKKINKRKFKKCVLKDATNLGLITRADLPIIGLILVLLFCNSMYFFFIGFIYLKTSLLQEFAYKLTQKGGEEKDKMLKLKAFLHNFSKIENVNTLDHNIWDRFLPFAIVLGENDNFSIDK